MEPDKSNGPVLLALSPDKARDPDDATLRSQHAQMFLCLFINLSSLPPPMRSGAEDTSLDRRGNYSF
jgi:hypothetical protein